MEIFSHQFHNNYNGDSQLPPGFRFHPTDEELITCYLLPKVLDPSFTCRAIADADLNKSDPWELPQMAKMGEKEWYFFSLRDRKYPTGLRTNRATKAGYWKATGKDREIYSTKTSCLVGMKKTLVFYQGRAPKGEKTNWVMHEYRLEGKFAYHFLPKTSKDEQAISRVFQKNSSGGNGGSGTKRLASEMNSSTSVLDSPYASAAMSVYTTDHDGYSEEHVPCFSTVSAGNFSCQSIFDLPPPPLSATSFAGNTTGCFKNAEFPSLQALQENLQVPAFFYSSEAAQPPVHGDTVMCNYGSLSGENLLSAFSPAIEKYKAGPTELDCIWSF